MVLCNLIDSLSTSGLCRREIGFTNFKLKKQITEKMSMEAKRKAMDGALVPSKRPRNELVAFENTENALLQSVSVSFVFLVISRVSLMFRSFTVTSLLFFDF